MEPLLRDDSGAMKSALDQVQPPEVMTQSHRLLDLFEKTTFDVAILGVTGAGKSSLINALRGVDDDDDNAAQTDRVKETIHPERYPHPLLPNVTLWKLPGTEHFQPERYLKQVHFDQYDLFIIVSSTRFTKNEAKLAQEIQKRKKFYFVRSKIDIDLQIERWRRDFQEEKTLEKIKQDCQQNLQQRGQPTPTLFLISRWDLDKYDFPCLQKTLEVELKEFMRSREGSETTTVNLLMESLLGDYFAASIPEAIAQICQKLDLFEKITLDIALIGVAGAGKSSLVNAMRGLDDDDDKNNAAKTGPTQGTFHLEGYPHPFSPNLKFWDLPGIGTQGFEAGRYLRQVHFDKYDLFIIVSSARFTENDANLAREIQKRKKKFYFVRTKIDIDLDNECRKKAFRQEKVLMKIRNDCLQHLEQPRVFLTSRWDLDKYDFPYLQMTLENELRVSRKDTLDTAILGVAGAGKSSLVNAMRGLDDEDAGAAKADLVEGTKHPERYPHPLLPNTTIWDLPGIGTGDFEGAKYLKQEYFEKSDIFIIVSSTCFTENDVNLAHEIQKRKKKVYFVRSKIDIALGFESRKKDFKEEKTLEKIKNDCYQQLTKSDQPVPRVFLVSRWNLKKYDFPSLERTLEEELDDLKSRVFILALLAFSKDILEQRKKAMLKVIWIQALLSGTIGAIPVPGLPFPCNIAILMETLRLICKVFGLDDDSIGRLVKRVGKNKAILRSAIKKSPLACEITPEFVTQLLQKSVVCPMLMGLEFAFDFVPILGSVTGGGLSFATTFHMLKGFLNDAEEDAKNVLAKVFECS